MATRATSVSTGPPSPRPPVTQAITHAGNAITVMINPRQEKLRPTFQLISGSVSLPKTVLSVSFGFPLAEEFSVNSWWHIAKMPRIKAVIDAAWARRAAMN